MAQPHRAGHKFGNKKMRRKVERKQRQTAKVYLAGKGRKPRKKKPKKQGVAAKVRQPYPCGPKQMALGEVPT